MITIALAEDHLLMRNAICSLLERTKDYEIRIKAENGFQLIDLIQQSKNLPNVVLLDIQMPSMDGVATAHYLKTHFPKIPIIAISSHTHHSIIQDIFDAGVMGFLSKTDLTFENINTSIATVISGVPFVDDSLLKKKLVTIPERNSMGDTGHPEISKKEKTYLQLVDTSLTNEEIAQLMTVSFESIYNYQKSLKSKLGFCTRRELTPYAIQHKIAKIARYHK